MSREVKEWIGKNDSEPVPERVRIRQFERDGGRCQCGCGILIRPGDKWDTDHRVAIINGGENRESNLQTLLAAHHKQKSRQDVAEKSRVYRKRAKHLGIMPNRLKIQSRGFQKFEPQRTASRPIVRHSERGKT